MQNLFSRLGQMFRQRLSLKVIVGGRAGMVAWGLSGIGVVAALIWGVKLIAMPLLMIKTASWGIWGVGVVRESQQRKRSFFSMKKRGDEEGREGMA